MNEIEQLREAARLMRARAEAATPGRRGWESWSGGPVTTSTDSGHDLAEYRGANVPPLEIDDIAEDDPEWGLRQMEQAKADAIFDASWDPAVALAVADWLQSVFDNLSTYNAMTHESQAAMRVARAYLGSEAAGNRSVAGEQVTSGEMGQ